MILKTSSKTGATQDINCKARVSKTVRVAKSTAKDGQATRSTNKSRDVEIEKIKPGRASGLARKGRCRTPIENSEYANVLASGKAASSPSSPSSTAAESVEQKPLSKGRGCLRGAPGGSGRALALRCARRPRASAGDGRTDASGGGSKLRMQSLKHGQTSENTERTTPERVLPRAQDVNICTAALASSDSARTTPERVLPRAQDDCQKVVHLSSAVANSLEPPTRSRTQDSRGAQEERCTVSHSESSSSVEQVSHHAEATFSDVKQATGVLANVRTAENRAMPKRYVGIDLGKKPRYCEIREEGVVARGILSKPDDLEALLGPNTAPATVAFEACREAWHYHDLLTSWGHKVLVVDTTRVRSLGIGHHKRKNDRIDAEVLARAVQSGRVPLAHVLSPERRQMREDIAVRRALVQTQAEYVTTIRGMLRSWGVHVPSCDTNNFVSKVEAAKRNQILSKHRYTQILPLLSALRTITPQVDELDKKLQTTVDTIDVAQILVTCPGVGSVVACSYISVIDQASRFHTAHQVESYLGLVPSEDTSGKRKLGSITKAGNGYLRALLVQAAWNVLRVRGDDPIKIWGQNISKRRGKRIAAIAVARRLAGVLWAMWRDGTAYDPAQLGKDTSRGLKNQAKRIHSTVARLSSDTVPQGGPTQQVA
jgi:transposase